MRLAAVCIALALLLAATTLRGADEPVGEAIQLFNGKDLTGWVWGAGGNADTKIEDVWTVVDGNLRCLGRPNGYIRTEKDYTNFILRLQIRHLRPGNGGILLRMTGPDKVWPKSIEAQGQAGALGDIWNIDRFPMKVDPARTRDRQTVRMQPDVKEKPLGEWNDYEIILDNDRLTLKVNGVVQNEATEVQVIPGKICLQSEGAQYEFRHIELIPLPDR